MGIIRLRGTADVKRFTNAVFNVDNKHYSKG